MRETTVMVGGGGGLVLLLACGGGGGLERAAVERPAAATVQVSLSVLDALDAAGIARLEQHLTASAAWTVTHERTRRIATRSWRQAGAWLAGSNGYWSDFTQAEVCQGTEPAVMSSPRCASDAVLQGRVLLALSEPQTLTHGDRGQFTRSPLEGTVILALEDYLDQPGRNSWLVVQGAHLMVEIMEQTEPDARLFTQAALDGLRDEVQAVRVGQDEIARRGFLADWAPPEGWTTAAVPPLTLRAGSRPGRYDVTLWLNPGQPGDLSLRLVMLGPAAQGPLPAGIATGEAVPISHQLPRRLGWGADLAVRFSATTPLWVERGVPGEALRGRLEVLLQPDDGGPERVLAAVEQDLTGREAKNGHSPAGGRR